MALLLRSVRAALVATLLITTCRTIAFSQTSSSPPLVPYSQLVTGLPEVPFSQLSDQTISPDGQRALAIHPGNWKHAESRHFILHFIHNNIANTVSIEAECYYRYIAADLGVSPTSTAKSHIYLFENGDDWELFVRSARLEEWTGAVTINNELFVPRNPKYKFKGHELAHEVVHLMVHRFIGTKLPLWLEEGYAENIGLSACGTYYRVRGYSGRLPRSELTSFIPLARLTALKDYPPAREVVTFYDESNWLTGFLNSFGNEQHFLKMLTAMAQGAPFESSLRDAYGSRWLSLDDLENDFKKQLPASKQK